MIRTLFDYYNFAWGLKTKSQIKNNSLYWKKRIYSVLVSMILVISFTSANATNYYVSNSGDDSNPGTSESSPWQTISKVNASTFSPGDKILFQRGDTFYGSLTIRNSGSSGNPIVYGAYGTGLNPVITGFTDITE